VKLYCAKNNSPFTCSHEREFIEAENFSPSSSVLSPVNFSLCGALQQAFYRQKIRDVVCYTAESEKSGHNKRKARPTAKRLTIIVFMACSRRAGFLLPYRCS